MKKIFFFILVLIVSLSHAQKVLKKRMLNIEKQVYNYAVEYHDVNMAKNAVYRIIALEGRQSNFLDTLVYIYFNQKKYFSCLKVANEILQEKEKLSILELKAISLEKLNNTKAAIDVYEKIYKQKKEPYIAYSLAKLQRKMKDYDKAYVTLKNIEISQNENNILIPFPGAEEGKVQNVPFKAAYYNLLALVSYDLDNYDMAIRYFDKALEEFPDFFVAQQNKQFIKLKKQ